MLLRRGLQQILRLVPDDIGLGFLDRRAAHGDLVRNALHFLARLLGQRLVASFAGSAGLGPRRVRRLDGFARARRAPFSRHPRHGQQLPRPGSWPRRPERGDHRPRRPLYAVCRHASWSSWAGVRLGRTTDASSSSSLSQIRPSAVCRPCASCDHWSGVAFAAAVLLLGGLPRRFFGAGVAPTVSSAAALAFARAIYPLSRGRSPESYFIFGRCAYTNLAGRQALLAHLSKGVSMSRKRAICCSISTTAPVPSTTEYRTSLEAGEVAVEADQWPRLLVVDAQPVSNRRFPIIVALHEPARRFRRRRLEHAAD